MKASFVPVQRTQPSDQGRRNKLPISIGDTRPFSSYRAAAVMQRYEDRNMRIHDGWGLYCGEVVDRRSLGANGGKLTAPTTARVSHFFPMNRDTQLWRLKIVYHAVITLSRPSRTGCRVLLRSGKLPRCLRWVCGLWSSWALRGAWPDCRGSAKPSHASANQKSHARGHLGRHSLRLCRGVPSRPTRRAYAKLSGRWPL
jgi:hypothetical protein